MRSKFNDLVVYRLSVSLADELYEATREWKPFERWSIGLQLMRAMDSVGANIAVCTALDSRTRGRFPQPLWKMPRKFITASDESTRGLNRSHTAVGFDRAGDRVRARTAWQAAAQILDDIALPVYHGRRAWTAAEVKRHAITRRVGASAFRLA